MKNKLFKNLVLLGGIVFVSGVEIVGAYAIPDMYKPSLAPDIPDQSYSEGGISLFFQFLAGNLLFFAGAVAVVLLVWAGAMYATSMGNDSQMEKAKKTIQWVVIGLLGMILSWAIVKFVIGFFLELPK